MAHPLLEII